ncbi:hypothetical protein H072_1191 [Dactylellina haptotyla CBS 200.50]|uniref:Cell wall proline rich protein n=1 Tax=Dactylellina haptotyla (strain CBS 200.50) TaxID=1284197 RepID=S8AVA0_DACHA|nr:hypothetical protein H072_1191 [Dactylellina haptotyla CBS 200.50]
MATASTQFQPQSLPSRAMQTFVFPSKAAATPTKRPSSSSAVPSRTSISGGMPSPTYSDSGASPANSPSGFIFPMRQTATFPRTTSGNLLAPGTTGVQARTPPASPSPPNATLGERRFHARRQSELISGRPLSLGTINQPFKFGSPITTPSPSKNGAGSPAKEGTSPKFASQNGLLSPPPETTNPEPVMEKLSAAPPPPGMQGRRGHAHRRSSAMSMTSTEVLNMMITAAKANNNINTNKAGGSAPPSPSAVPETPLKEAFGGVADNVSGSVTDSKMVLDVPLCESSASSIINITDDSAESARTSVEEAPRKTRVMFSDVTEIIPRPASAGTCSTFTTIRGGMSDSVSSLHGYRNSISSMDELYQIDSRSRRASASDASGVPRLPRTKTDRRPNSADAATLLNGAQKTGWLFPPLSPKDPFSKKKGHSKHLSESSATEKPKRKNRKSSNPDGVPSTPKKVKGGMKGWAGNILLKRHYKKRQLKHLPRRTPTPPLMHLDEIERLMLEGNYVLMPTSVADYEPRDSSSMDESEFEPQIDLGAYETDIEIEVETDSNFPVIDLDVALGPMSSPKSPSRPLSGFESARKRMHSAAGWNCYHRRAESMPEMQLFSLAEDEIEGNGMGDVFEDTEEEDDDEEDEEGDITLRVEDLPKPVMPAGLALNWDTDDSEIEELDIVDGVANVRKGIKRKMSRLSEDTDPASDSQRSEDGGKADDAIVSIEALSIPTPTTDSQFSPTLSTNTHLTTPMSNVSGNVSYNSLHHASSFDQTPAVTPSTTNTSICPPTMPSTPHTSDFLLPPVPHLFAQEDDRITLMSGASIYEDPTLLGEPGPEIRMSVSVDDIPGTSHSQQKRFYSLFSASTSRNTMPGLESSSSIGSPDKPKDKKDKRWSKVFSFWKGGKQSSVN